MIPTNPPAPESENDVDVLLNSVVLVDLASPYLYLGRLVDHGADYLVLADVDAHDLRDTSTTRDRYIRDCRELGIHVTRRKVWVNRREVVAITRLDDVILD